MELMRICPKCGNQYSDHPAISRVDNKTEICPSCGVMEALEARENYIRSNAKNVVQIAVVLWARCDDITTYRFKTIDDLEQAFPLDERNEYIQRIDIIRINTQTYEQATSELYFIKD